VTTRDSRLVICPLVAEFELRQIGDMEDGMSKLAGRLGGGWKTMDRTSIDEGFDVGCMKLCEAVVQTSRHEDNGANSFKDLALGPLPLVSGFMFL